MNGYPIHVRILPALRRDFLHHPHIGYRVHWGLHHGHTYSTANPMQALWAARNLARAGQDVKVDIEPCYPK